jgi:hypothetical protein
MELVPLGTMTARLRKPCLLPKTPVGDRLIHEVEPGSFSGAVNSDGDTQTPLANGRVMAEHLGAPLISVVNDGQHGHYALRRNACVDALVNRYLVSGVLPASRVTCAGTDIAEDVPPGAAVSASPQSARPLSQILGEIASEPKPF